MRINFVWNSAPKLHQESPCAGVPEYWGKQASMQRVNLLILLSNHKQNLHIEGIAHQDLDDGPY